MDLTRKRGLTPRNRSIWAVFSDKIDCFFCLFWNPFATHPSAPALSVLLALSSLFVPLSVLPFCAPLCALLCASMSLPSLSAPPSCPPSCALSRASSLPPLSLCPLSPCSLSVPPLSVPSLRGSSFVHPRSRRVLTPNLFPYTQTWKIALAQNFAPFAVPFCPFFCTALCFCPFFCTAFGRKTQKIDPKPWTLNPKP